MDSAKRKALEEDWLKDAKRAFDQFFGDDSPGDRLTFRQIEASAVRQGDQLTRWLLEKKLETEQSACDGTTHCACPTCGKPAEAKEQGPEQREIITKSGRVGFKRPGFYCPSCRKVFFPSGPEA